MTLRTARDLISGSTMIPWVSGRVPTAACEQGWQNQRSSASLDLFCNDLILQVCLYFKLAARCLDKAVLSSKH